jgi:hypothetical protein
MGQLIKFHKPKPRENFTLNVVRKGDGGFCCIRCGCYTYDDELGWGEYTGGVFFYGHVRFRYCPGCGAEIITVEEWAERRPQDQGKTFAEIMKELGSE